jgi:predicted enzyme related to lactoylglutathione lyase
VPAATRGRKQHKEQAILSRSRIGNICYFVSDIARTEAFYRDVVGLEVQRMDDDGHGNAWLLASIANNVDLIFFKGECRPGNSPIIVFELAEGGIDDVIAGLAKKGATIVTPVSHAPGGWSGDFADPDGHTLSMYQSEEMPRSLG